MGRNNDESAQLSGRSAVAVAALASPDVCGPRGGESRGVVDLIAIRKNHGEPFDGTNKRGGTFQIILIQVKGGYAAKPTAEDAKLCAVARYHHARTVLLATWKKGKTAQFFSLGQNRAWRKVNDLKAIFE